MSLNTNKSDNMSNALADGIGIFHDDDHDIDLARMNNLNSRASGSLGAASPAAGVVRMALDRTGIVKCVTIPDELSMQTAGRFAGAYCVHPSPTTPYSRLAHPQ